MWHIASFIMAREQAPETVPEMIAVLLRECTRLRGQRDPHPSTMHLVGSLESMLETLCALDDVESLMAWLAT